MPKTRNSRLYPERFDLIDAFRGLAALAVVIHHVIGIQIGQPAVIVFFVISGYCIASAADACQRKGMTFAQFMWRRVRRIYPPYLLSLAFWAATRVLKWKMDGVNDLARPWTVWVQNITLTQWLTLLRYPVNYSAQNPTLFVSVYWSLDYEEQFYLLFGLMMLVAAMTRIRVPYAVAGLIVISVVWIAIFPTVCYGLFIEYWAMFGMGCVVFYRLCRLKRSVWRRAAEAIIVGLLLLSIAMRLAGAGGMMPVGWMDRVQPHTRVAWADLAVSAGFALLLLLIRPLDAWYKRNRWINLPLGSLGLITYSLYLIHQFNLNLAGTAVGDMFHLARVDHAPLLLSGALQCAVLVVIACLFWYFCERPFLNKSLLPVSGSASIAKQIPGPAKQ
jgi:peptidoglycan/LPS O-acetylase OafA/YrhL